MMRNHRDRFESERLRRELMGVGIGKDSPLSQLTPARAVLIMAVIVGAFALIVVVTSGSGLLSGEGYADDVRALSERLRLEDRELVPRALRDACLAGDAAGCEQHQANAGDQADRLEDHVVDLLGFNVASEAANFNADYTLALQGILESYRAEANALSNDNLEAFAVAAAQTGAALEREQALIEQLNRDFPAMPELVSDP